MARIWCCTVDVSLDKPMKVPGYPKSKDITVSVKARTETEKEPTDLVIKAAAKRLMDACYSVKVLKLSNPQTNFLLWDKI